MARLQDLVDDEFRTPEADLAIELAREDQHLLAELVATRKRLGISQDEVAEILGLSQATVSAFERVGNDPHLSTVRRYARALGVMIRHHVDEAGCDAGNDSHYISHVSDNGITSNATASAVARALSQSKGAPWPTEATSRPKVTEKLAEKVLA